MPLDSDDYVIPETLEVFWKAWNSIPDGERSEYCGVGVHCMDLDGNMIGDPYRRIEWYQMIWKCALNIEYEERNGG